MVIAYDDAYRAAPRGAHAEDALLGLAELLLAIKKRRSAACETMNQFRTQFPTPRADLAGTITAVRQRAGCGH